MKYTEEDLRKAFRAGVERGEFLERDEYAPIYIVDTEDEYIDSLNVKTVDEDKVCYSYSFLRRKLEWEDFCELTGIDYYATRNGFEIKDTELFYITESKAKEFNLL